VKQLGSDSKYALLRSPERLCDGLAERFAVGGNERAELTDDKGLF
jgi:hypothetical protein